ncbi:MAG: PA14 domain-containing protein [Ferruginibacter sp.]
MRHLILILCLFGISKVYANNYYFSSGWGDDTRSAIEAQNSSSPWKTLTKLNAFFPSLNPGDSVFFKRGDIFTGPINIAKSGETNKPIFFGAYGTGSKPLISGFTVLSNWASTGNGIYESTSASLLPTVNILLVNGQPKAIGRFPNANTTNKGYLNFEAAIGNKQITDNQLSASPDWTNGEVVIRKNRWVIDRNLITLHSGTAINYLSGSHYSADVNFGYFIQNHPKTLDLPGEWYFNAGQKKVGIFWGANNPGTAIIKAGNVSTLVSISAQKNIVFNNIGFEGANENAFNIVSSTAVSIIDCDIFFSGMDAINASKSTGINVQNSFINYTNNNALTFVACSNSIIKNNKINGTGTFPGMGKGDAGSYEAIMIDGDNNVIELNKIDSTGYIPLTFSGNSVIIKNNFINNYAFVKDDGGGIYTYNGSAVPKINNNRKIIGNIVLNGKGAGEGTTNPGDLLANGIYLDDKVNNVEVTGNTVANCSRYGLFVHNANNLIIRKNTVFNNNQQLGMVHDKIAPNDPIRNVSLLGNILFSKTSNSVVAAYKTIANDIKDFGGFDSNYYCRPVDDILTVNTSFVNNGATYSKGNSLDGWKYISGKDKASKISPINLASYKVNKLTGANKFLNGDFISNVGGLYIWSAAGNSAVLWKNGTLDGGALQISFSKITGTTNRASVIIGVGTLTADKYYTLKFSLKGTDSYKSLEVFLRKSLSGYNDLSERKNVLVKALRTENELVFKATSTESNASIVFNVEEQEQPLYVDNIQLYEADVSVTNPDASIRFEYNATTTTKAVAIDGDYIDVENKRYSGNVNLAPFTSVILLKHNGGVQATTPSSTACTGAGTILLESWNNVNGNNVSDIPLTKSADAVSQLTRLEINNIAEKYAARMRGYICPPETGGYTFYISGDDAAQLWLSTNDDPQNKVKIAAFLSWTNFRQWDKFPSQTSVSINLKKGQLYYIEVLLKQGGGGGHLSVGWKLPGASVTVPITGAALLPFNNYAVSARSIALSPKSNNEKKLVIARDQDLIIYPNPFGNTATIELLPSTSGEIRLQVADLQGRIIKNLFKGKVEAGIVKKFKLDGLSKGVYFIKLLTETRSLNKKVIVEK